MTQRIDTKIQNKYGDNISGQITHYTSLISALDQVKTSVPKLANFIDYIVNNFESTLALLKLQNVLDVK
ncbi:MAG: hypothetical protein GXP45_04495 [bacterium]|nr:hypothetical protein [bacterium]